MRGLLRASLALVLLLLLGFGWFLSVVPTEPNATATSTSAAVVLTGGSKRVELGYQRLLQGRSARLFITGVNGDAKRDEIFATFKSLDRAAYARLKDRIELGYVARDTVGNAIETSAWVAAQATPPASLRIVTASYHMPRALWEMHRALPGIRLIADPALPPPFDEGHWWASDQGRRLIFSEYFKLLYGIFRPLLPLHARSLFR